MNISVISAIAAARPCQAWHVYNDGCKEMLRDVQSIEKK